MKTLLLDVDGVIADFHKATENGMMKYFGLRPAREWTEWDIAKMDWKHWRNDLLRGTRDDHQEMLRTTWNQERFCASIPEYEGAVEQVKELSKIFDVYFVTSPMVTNPTWVYERSEWLIKKFGKDLGKKVVHTHYKELIDGDIFVDDKMQHVKDWWSYKFIRDGYGSSYSACLMGRPYNAKDTCAGTNYRRINSLKELLDYK